MKRALLAALGAGAFVVAMATPASAQQVVNSQTNGTYNLGDLNHLIHVESFTFFPAL